MEVIMYKKDARAIQFCLCVCVYVCVCVQQDGPWNMYGVETGATGVDQGTARWEGGWRRSKSQRRTWQDSGHPGSALSKNPINGWASGWMDGQMSGQMDG